MLKRVIFALSITVVASAVSAANWPDRPTLRAVRAMPSPAVDGDLSDPAWKNAPEFTDWTQHDPQDGQPGTLPTSLRILYDDHAIYFGLKMTDPKPPTSLLIRRDTFSDTDFISINIDPQHDRLSGNAFTITPAGVQMDSVLFNDIGEDGSWDGVWESATKIVPDGWIAEVRVPFSQLRFPDRAEHVWGLNITRRTVRTNEWVRIVNTKKGETGFVSHFADIVGLNGIHRGRPLELVPYAVGRADIQTRANPNDPLLDRRAQSADGGLDVKYALTSSLTLTGTINPDFGQVEVDPAVVNLSQFETFYPEKRPFFTEGTDLFRFDDTPAPSHFNFTNTPRIFYSRRIGRSPQARPDAAYVDAPTDTTILGAAKLTGRLPGGWSVAVLDALTDRENARFVGSSGIDRQAVEPMTNYFVGRTTKTVGDGSRVGFLLTSVERRLPDELTALRRSATTFGMDGYTSFSKKAWILEGAWAGTRVSGSPLALALTQNSPAHYYDRPDAGHVEFDPTRTSLTGWSGRAMLSKATGVWRPIVQVQAFSPGFETSDIGFMQRTDIISSHALMQYFQQKPDNWSREKIAFFGTWMNRNFDGDVLERGVFGDARVTFSNYWHARAALFLVPGALSDRLTRGGPLVKTPPSWSSDMSVESDSRKPFSYEIWTSLSAGGDTGEDSYSRTLGLELNARPAPNLQLSLEPTFSRSRTSTQYAGSFADPSAAATYGKRYLFANLEQHSFEVGTRADWTLSPRLSLQLYLQPFIASGDYHDYRTLDAAKTRRFSAFAADEAADDFNFRSVRGSAVMRWEFRPGSALFVAWNENRARFIPGLGDFRIGRDLRGIPSAPSQDVFMVKVSYWLPM